MPRHKTRDVTVDVCVVIAAAGDEQHYGGQTTGALALLTAMKGDPRWALALDSANRIRTQYNEKLRELPGLVRKDVVKAWLGTMIRGDRCVIVGPLRGNRRINAERAIADARISDEDSKYVKTAAGSRCKVLVTHNSRCFNSRACSVLRSISVKVLAPVAACRL